MEKLTIILDNGHGVDTPGKRSPIWPDGSQLFEYEFNRDIVARVASQLDKLGIKHIILVPELHDISLKERCRRANAVKNGIVISVHANAGGGTGLEIFTSTGATVADDIATIFCDTARDLFKDKKMRFDFSDSDPDKEADFYILKHTRHPALLTENFFMDYEPDCRFIMSEEGRSQVAKYLVQSIIQTLDLWPTLS